ncbi:MAG: ABC transporter substrate-binding protein [Anaerolineae bacterium]|jgi:peptide/nickel transport system substrate-binding protein
MSAGKLRRRTFLSVSALAASSAALAACGGGQPAPTAPTEAPAEPTTAPAEPTATTAAAAEPTTPPEATAAPAEPSPTSAAEAAPSRYNEAPMLAERVAAGELPPVDERLPVEPLMQQVEDEIGEYGGTWHRAATNASDAYYRLYREALIYFDIEGNLVPSVAKSWEVSEDGTEFTFYLREGMKWSDGEPFTADAVMWWHDHIYNNEELTPLKPAWMRVGGEYGTIEKVDDYTIRYRFAAPYGTFLEWLATSCFHGVPGHYLEQFHIDFRDQAELEAAAQEAGFEQWFQYFNDRSNTYQNPERPVIEAWQFVTLPDQNPLIVERNPYYYRVDPEGNQLPYIDRIQFEVVPNAEVLNFMAIAGELDCQGRHINLINYPLFVEGQEQGNYHIVEWPCDGGAEAGLMFNQNAGFQEGATDHQMVIGDLLRTVEFRQALSSAIDRDEIWNSAFLGFGEPRQMAPMPWSEYYEEGMETPFIEFDVDLANQMLDDLGLDKRDAEGYRLAPDGQPIDITIAVVDLFGPWVDTAQLANSHWNAVGIRSAVNVEERSLHYTRMAAGEHQVSVWMTGGNGKVLIYPHWTMPYASSSRIGPLSGIWYQSGGTQGVEPEGDLRRVQELFDQAQTTIDDEERIELGKEIFRINSRNLWTIGTIGGTPLEQGLLIVKNNFFNVPESTPERHVFNEDSVHSPSNCVPAQFFIRQA